MTTITNADLQRACALVAMQHWEAPELEEVSDLLGKLAAEIERLHARQEELLRAIVRVTNETPYSDEIAGWQAQRAAMIAEIGSLRAEVAAGRALAQDLQTRAFDDLQALRAEVNRMRPVYDAAIALDVGEGHPDYGIASQRLAVARTGHERKETP